MSNMELGYRKPRVKDVLSIIFLFIEGTFLFGNYGLGLGF